LAGNQNENPEALFKLFCNKVHSRGVKGMVGLQRIFTMMDDDQSGSLSQREFFKACKDFKLGISEENVPALFRLFDRNNDGVLAYDEFLAAVRGNLSNKRSQVVRQVFDFLSEKCGGKFNTDYAKKVYDASRHPHVLQGKRTEDN